MVEYTVITAPFGTVQCFLSIQWKSMVNIIQNTFFYVPQKKESHSSLERHEGK